LSFVFVLNFADWNFEFVSDFVLGIWDLKEGDRGQMLFSTFYILPSTNSEMAIGKWRLAIGGKQA
jgi:hypothetical protein